MSQYNTKRIGLNTVFLSIRKIITLAIALYSTRLLLSRLGEDDFGLYGLVGSIVVLFSALRQLFSTSIQRFINAAKGKENTKGINEIFSLGLKIHIIIAFFFIVVVEIAGILMLPTLNLPPRSVGTAFWVLQFTIFATAVTILTVPYDAIIIANEKFLAFSIIAIVENIIKLVIIWMLCFFSQGRVVIYAALFFGVTIIVRFINSLYCHYTFPAETKYHRVRNPLLLRQMTSFAGWQFFGNMGFALANSGLNFIINIFGGVVVNAARTIAYQVMNAASQFVSDLNLSFQPQTVISYTSGDIPQFRKLMFLNTKSAFIISLLLGVPVYICAPGVLGIWLGEIPPYTVQFTRWILIYMIIRSLHGPIDLMFKANGHLKVYQITEFIIMSATLPISWMVLKMGFPYWSVFAVMSIFEIVNLIAIIIIAIYQINFSAIDYMKAIGSRVIVVDVLLFIISMTILPITDNISGFLPLVFAIVCSIFSVGILSFFIILDQSERAMLLTFVLDKFSR